MSDSIKVSVVIPLYNAERYVGACLNSILSQSLKEIEVIVIDDCSTDNSLEIVKYFNDNRLIVLRNEENQGVTKALNRGINLASGEYIARMDADDIAFKDRLKIQYEYFQENNNIDILASQVVYLHECSESGEVKFNMKHKELTDKKIKGVMLAYNPLMHPTVMFKNNEKAIYDETVNVSQDYMKWLDLLHSCNFSIIKRPLLFYRVTEGSVTNSSKNNKIERHSIIMDKFNKKNNISISKKELKNYLYAIHSPNKSEISMGMLDQTFNLYKNHLYNSIKCSSIIEYRFGYIWLSVLVNRRSYKRIFSKWTVKGSVYILYKIIKDTQCKISFLINKKYNENIKL
ncbi:glycosyltransferase family 2 protein [Halalkalibacter sp. AB-rgal2]|uniref:glycosyltransferase family 2 protein n=1 Tax=Halalkalibacter sp. AB-rgal2 TaxID=3242695 RepID=UPI00359D0BF0